jgi:hypothetical protein
VNEATPERNEPQRSRDELTRRDFVKGAAAAGIVVGGAYMKPALKVLGVARLAAAASIPPQLPPPSPGHGCTPGFWANNSSRWQGGGVLWWDTSPDAQWTSFGGLGNPPFIRTTLFNSFFTPNTNLAGLTMWDVANGGGGNDAAHRAGRQLVAAYLNAAFGSFPYTTVQLRSMWTSATNGGNGTLNALEQTLNTANMTCDQTLGS